MANAAARGAAACSRQAGRMHVACRWGMQAARRRGLQQRHAGGAAGHAGGACRRGMQAGHAGGACRRHAGGVRCVHRRAGCMPRWGMQAACRWAALRPPPPSGVQRDAVGTQARRWAGLVRKTSWTHQNCHPKIQPSLVDFFREFCVLISGWKASRRQQQEHKPGSEEMLWTSPNCHRKINQI